MDTESFEHRKLIQRREQSVQVLFDELDNTELDGCKFLCEPYIESASLEGIRNGSELVPLLARKRRIDFEQPHFDFLVELLYRVHRLDLVMNLGSSAENVRTKYGNIQHTNMIAFRCLLLSLSYDLTNKNLEAILEILRSDDDIGIGRLSRIKTVLDLFRLLMKEVKLKHDDFQQLTQIVDLIGRQDLLSKIRHHEDKSRRAITLHASIDSMRSSYCNDTGRKAYKDKETVFMMEEPLVLKYSKQFTCVKEIYPHKECSSPLPGLQGFNNLSSLLGKQYGKETPAKHSPNLSSQGFVASIEHFDTRAPDLMDSELLSKMPCELPEPMLPAYDKKWFSSSSIRDQDGKDTQEVASPEQIVSLPPQGASFL
ncbi:uncharacterized protein LOC110467135 [Mizuhopecten yessoensis]|uniref:uncharacterized protein LOC110467135 n=1 Tax=Mizuhopecten yessoensis TaxID=6573 RepID=UPI000B45B958|nr:uncharacterized protein LOC110467135 [Mizuhopecten yessoensis]XP_021379911.1 uncharacterized protein LOC110467135 [Mizuhopecten yessoensis]XP_021379997.1 uncharacterized protein LOC110467135 [Mizuhopecten yessoensis]XP_021380080.1 uncharacterized protein LOC110467135 [Mizuhopecten yessoensis]